MLGALALRDSKWDELFTMEVYKEGGKDRHACIYTHIYIYTQTNRYIFIYGKNIQICVYTYPRKEYYMRQRVIVYYKI